MNRITATYCGLGQLRTNNWVPQIASKTLVLQVLWDQLAKNDW